MQFYYQGVASTQKQFLIFDRELIGVRISAGLLAQDLAACDLYRIARGHESCAGGWATRCGPARRRRASRV